MAEYHGPKVSVALLLTRLSAARAGYLDELDFALQEAIAALQTDLDAPAQYMADLTTLESRLTAARAGYLDELDFDLAAAIAAIPTTMVGTDGAALAASWTAALATALAAYTAARGAYLDNINNADLANIIRDVAEATDTFSFDETSAAAQTLATVTIAARSKVGGIWLDMVNVTQDTTIKLLHKVDGTNFREVSSHAWVTTDADGVLLEGFTAYRDVRITLTCGGGGGVNVNVPYAVV